MTQLPDRDTDLSRAIDAALKEQRRYEERRTTRLGQGTERVMAPASRLIRRFVPPGMMRAALEAADRGTGLTLPRELSGHDTSELALCEAAALRVQAWSAGSAAATGGVSGWFGGAGMTLDIPATITIAARNVRATGLSFGFSGEAEEERIFRLALLELATVQGLEGRNDALGRINRIASELNEPEVRMITEKATEWVVEKVLDRVARSLGTDLLKRKASQVVPIAGGVIAAGINASFQTDVGRAARYGYRMRWLMHRQVLPAPEVVEE
ncbi:EcsC family protein [Actibacterium sp. 188UL27-1]|uniref:EcsC family protein n=1 Tax=Actibacterium sp. 188UL27-1 TaxID=2786961 RepID=UPI00195E181D|nr:EcsC family protein [Actibacterium sp. 188UL27-1]MBM7067780.1 EcsC family protein [Actibacterium sp. 188UL27-1]